MFDGIEFRGFAQDTVEQLADYAGVPVWNGLTDQWHPTQMLADVLTMTEHHRGRARGRSPYCFLGDGRNNVARSLLVTGALLGMDVRIAAPPRAAAARRRGRRSPATLAERSGARVLVTDDVDRGGRTAPTSSTPTSGSAWANPTTNGQRGSRSCFPYRVTAELMARPASRHQVHALPALDPRRRHRLGRAGHRPVRPDGAEVSDDVFESAGSIVFDQAENRLHTIKAVTGRRPRVLTAHRGRPRRQRPARAPRQTGRRGPAPPHPAAPRPRSLRWPQTRPVICHGNGPQVGLLAFESEADTSLSRPYSNT